MSETQKSLHEFYETKVKDIMQSTKSDLPCIDETTDVATVFNTLNKKDHVWIVDNKEPTHLLGVITESDTISLLAPPLTSLQSFDKPDIRSLQYEISLTADEIMSKKPVSISPDKKIRDVLLIMKEQKIKQIAVVDINERFIGEISVRHLIQVYSKLHTEFIEKKKIEVS